MERHGGLDGDRSPRTYGKPVSPEKEKTRGSKFRTTYIGRRDFQTG